MDTIRNKAANIVQSITKERKEFLNKMNMDAFGRKSRSISQWMVKGEVDQHVITDHNTRGFRYFCEELTGSIMHGDVSATLDEFFEQVVSGLDRDRSNAEEELTIVKTELMTVSASLAELRAKAISQLDYIKRLSKRGKGYDYEQSLYEKTCFWGKLMSMKEDSLIRRQNTLANRLSQFDTEQEIAADVGSHLKDDSKDDRSKEEYNTIHWNECWKRGEQTLDIVINRVHNETNLSNLYKLNARINQARINQKDGKVTRIGNMPYYWYAKCKAIIEGRIAVLKPTKRNISNAMMWKERADKVKARPNQLAPAEEQEVQFNPDAKMSGQFGLNEDAMIALIDRSRVAKELKLKGRDFFEYDEEEVDPDQKHIDIVALYEECRGNVSEMSRRLGKSRYLAKKQLVQAIEEALLWQ